MLGTTALALALLCPPSLEARAETAEFLIVGRSRPDGWHEEVTAKSSPDAGPALITEPTRTPLLAGEVVGVEPLGPRAYRVTIRRAGRTTVRQVGFGQPGEIVIADTVSQPSPARIDAVSRYRLVDPGALDPGASWLQTGSDLTVAHPVVSVVGANRGVALLRDPEDARSARSAPNWVEAKGTEIGIGLAAPDGTAPALPTRFTNRFTILLGEREGRPDRSALGRRIWQRNVPRRLAVALPQTIPFQYTTRPAYVRYMRSSRLETNGQWWSKTAGTWTFGGPDDQETLSFTADANLLRAAWGMRWWGERLGQPDWQSRSAELMRLAVLGAEHRDPTQATVYRPGSGTWGRGSVADVATTAYWLRRWRQDFAAFRDEPRLAAVDRALGARARDQAQRPQGLAAAAALSRYLAPSGAKVPIPSTGADTFAAERFRLQAALAAPPDSLDRDRVARAADSIALSQALWAHPASDALTLGAFLDQGATSIQGSETGLLLMRAGAVLDRPDLFQRGVLAVRSGFSLLRLNVAGRNGVFGPPSAAEGQAAAGYRLAEGFSPDRRFEAGAGSLLATLAEAMNEFGSGYIDRAGWAVGIDGVFAMSQERWDSALATNPFPYGGTHRVTVRQPGVADRNLTPSVPFAISRLDLDRIDGRLMLVQVPSRSSLPTEGEIAGRFIVGDRLIEAEKTPYGLGAQVDPRELLAHRVTAAGSLGQTLFDLRDVDVYAWPPLDPMAIAPRGWARRGGLARTIVPTVYEEGRPALHTGDDGRGRRVPELTGTLVSAEFSPQPGQIVFALAGSGGRAELVDAETNIHVLSARPGRTAKRVVWTTTGRKERRLFVRLVDDSKTGMVVIRHPRFEPVSR